MKEIDKSLIDKEANYVFNRNGSYALYLEGNYRNHGYYAYKKIGPNAAHLVISFVYDETDELVYYVMYLQFTGPGEGKFKATDLDSTIDGMSGTFNIAKNKLKD